MNDPAVTRRASPSNVDTAVVLKDVVPLIVCVSTLVVSRDKDTVVSVSRVIVVSSSDDDEKDDGCSGDREVTVVGTIGD